MTLLLIFFQIAIYLLELYFLLFQIKCAYRIRDVKSIGIIRIGSILLFLASSILAFFSLRIWTNYFQTASFVFCVWLLYARTRPVNYTIPYMEGELLFYNQKDTRWGAVSYGHSTLAKCGCLPTALAIALSAKDKEVTPVTVAQWIYRYASTYICPKGTKVDCVAVYAEQNQYEYIMLDIHETDCIAQHLNQGYIFFCILPNSYFYGLFAAKSSRSNHVVLMVSQRENQYMLVDPCIYFNGNNSIGKETFVVYSQLAKSQGVIGIKII